MAYTLNALENLTDKFRSLPGIGSKSARRLAFFILSSKEEDVEDFASTLVSSRKAVHFCSVCQNLTEKEKCQICEDEKRDRSVICVVESPSDVLAIEKTNEYRGLYHVLHGDISPEQGRGPGDLKIKELLYRLADDSVKEVIIATNPTIEGEMTASYISRILSSLNIRSTRLAFGIPIGSNLEFADELTLSKAIENRMNYDEKGE